jgi:hypothetical protein
MQIDGRHLEEHFSKVASTRISNGHGRYTRAHALIQHSNVVVEGIVGSGAYFEVLVVPVHARSAGAQAHGACHSRNFGLVFRAATQILVPPNPQNTLDNIMLQAVEFFSVPEELERRLNLDRVKVAGWAFAEGQAKAVPQRVARRLGELDSPQAVAQHMSVCVENGPTGH